MFGLITECRLCGGPLRDEIASLPRVAVAGTYVRPDSPGPDPAGPLTLMRCDSCSLVQLKESIHSSFYSQYKFLTGSGGYGDHIAGLVASLTNALPKGARILEIGASDGTVLSALAQRGFETAGFEPSASAAQYAAANVQIVNDYFSSATVNRCPFPTADAVLMRHVLEHVEHLSDLFVALDSVSGPSTRLFVEVPDLHETVRNRIFSNIYHIHCSYFDVRSMTHLLDRFGWIVDDARIVPVFGGSLFVSASRGTQPAQNSTWEGPAAVSREQLGRFAADWRHELGVVGAFFAKLKSDGRRLAGYGAAERTTALLSSVGLDNSHFLAVYDGNPALAGLALPDSRIPIRPPAELVRDQPDLVAVFARSHEEEILRAQAEFVARGGRFITMRTSPPTILASREAA